MKDVAIIRIEHRSHLFVVTVDDQDKESFEARDEAEIWAIDWASRNAGRYCIYY